LFFEKNIKSIISILRIKDVFKKYGTYWRNSTQVKEGIQIDIVIERTDNVTHLIECKWSRSDIGKSIVGELLMKKDLYPNPKKHTLKLGLIVSCDVTFNTLKSNIVDDIIYLRDILK
jgi:hypothetical protein